MSRPRLGFLGCGWIGRHRMQAMLAGGAAEAAALADPDPDALSQAQTLAPGAAAVDGIYAMLALGLDGIVIATPSAQHAGEAIAALNAGAAVFCQKPLARTAAEARAVVDAARAVDRLLGVDLSYRETAAMRAIRPLVQDGALGRVFAADLVFHNAYGPGRPWFFDPALSGGGCLMDLGVHLIDLALWTLGWPEVVAADTRLIAGGAPLADSARQCEDYAAATLTLADGAVVTLQCSWNLAAGQEAVIAARFYGTEGGAGFENVGGSFYDFTAWRARGTAREALAAPPDDWGGRAAAAWAERLAAGERFDAEADRLVTLHEVLDRLYGR